MKCRGLLVGVNTQWSVGTVQFHEIEADVTETIFDFYLYYTFKTIESTPDIEKYHI